VQVSALATSAAVRADARSARIRSSLAGTNPTTTRAPARRKTARPQPRAPAHTGKEIPTCQPAEPLATSSYGGGGAGTRVDLTSSIILTYCSGVPPPASHARGGDAFAVLSNPIRRHMLELLAGGERRATELAAPFAVSRSAVAQHLRVMVSSGVVTQRRAERERYYGSHREQLGEMDRWLRLLDDLCAQANNRRVGTAIACAASITGVETPHPNRGIGGHVAICAGATPRLGTGQPPSDARAFPRSYQRRRNDEPMRSGVNRTRSHARNQPRSGRRSLRAPR
jgi:DNA-binding transcriptional ArsR family regulator